MADKIFLQQQHQHREHAIAARRNLTSSARENASIKITDKVIRSTWFQRNQNFACYLSTQFEVDTWGIIARAWLMKKRIFAPVCAKNSKMFFRELTPDSTLNCDQHGILVPESGKIIAPRQLDIVITPVVAYDNCNNRIGMGGGFFDRTFSFLRHRKHLHHPKLVGVAFQCQKVEKISANPWDIRLFSVVSDS